MANAQSGSLVKVDDVDALLDAGEETPEEKERTALHRKLAANERKLTRIRKDIENLARYQRLKAQEEELAAATAILKEEAAKAEAVAFRKQDARLKIILGAAVLSLDERRRGEVLRDALAKLSTKHHDDVAGWCKGRDFKIAGPRSAPDGVDPDVAAALFRILSRMDISRRKTFLTELTEVDGIGGDRGVLEMWLSTLGENRNELEPVGHGNLHKQD